MNPAQRLGILLPVTIVLPLLAAPVRESKAPRSSPARLELFIVHQVANGANVPGLENVANLETLPATGSWIVALPMKIAGGSGGPLRIIALLPESR